MNTILVLVFAVAGISAHWHGHHHHHPGHGPHGRCHHFQNDNDGLFLQLAEEMKTVDTRVEESCVQHSNSLTKEIVETSSYTLTTPLTGFSETDFKIQVSGRVIYVSALNGQTANYTEIRTLPTFVDTSKASYTYSGTDLDIVFPINAEASTCNLDLSGTVTNVALVKFPVLVIEPRHG